MGLMNLFKPKAAGTPTKALKNEKDITNYSQMRGEVTSRDGQVLFVGKLIHPQETTAELYPYSESEPPGSEAPIPVRIRGYHDNGRKAVYMEGVIALQPEQYWKAEELKVVKVVNDRAFFRVDVNVAATATTFGDEGAVVQPCKLVNISVGGACVACSRRYWEGDRFQLNVQLQEDQEPSIILCEVLRILEKADSSYSYTYGCCFREMSETEEGKIAQSIFAIQRKMRASGK